jgi:hypothetical protein
MYSTMIRLSALLVVIDVLSTSTQAAVVAVVLTVAVLSTNCITLLGMLILLPAAVMLRFGNTMAIILQSP